MTSVYMLKILLTDISTAAKLLLALQIRDLLEDPVLIHGTFTARAKFILSYSGTIEG